MFSTAKKKNYIRNKTLYLTTKIIVISLIICSLFLFLGCKSKQLKRQGPNYSSIGDFFASDIIANFSKNDPVYFAMLGSVNDTTRIIPVEVIEDTFIRKLLSGNIYVVRREGRSDTIEELKLAMAGLVEGGINSGQLISPDYFARIRIDEQQVILAGKQKKTVELFFTLELREAKSQIVVYSQRKSLGIVKNIKTGSDYSW